MKLKRLIAIIGFVFVLLNVVAIIHAYKFTHFNGVKVQRTNSPDKLSFFQKVGTVLTGVNNPRPVNQSKPIYTYQELFICSNKKLSCWLIPVDNAKGTVLMFHGYCSEKSSLLDKAYYFRSLGYNTFLADFMGSGGSEGCQTTIGYMEAQQVRACYDFVRRNSKSPVFLYGSSMGAAAVMKAFNDGGLKPNGLMLECPFGSMYQTVSARFDNMGLPAFPMASLLVFWGGLENGFWGFSHNPEKYAEQIDVPTLLMYGSVDDKVSRNEMDVIFNNLKGKKNLLVFEGVGHEDYFKKANKAWRDGVKDFVKEMY